jgi:iron complex outermembrane recepter protein
MKNKTWMALAPLAAALAAPAALAEDQELENIVVTAQSRAQSEREVPIAMQVVTLQQIEDLGAANLSDMNGYVPGLSVDGSQPTQPNFSLRGIGTGDFGIGTDAAVGVYVDGVYAGKTGGSLLDFNDVQRVEVLKGPQGTLFGRNSAAGAISIVANEPEQGTDANAMLRYGRWNTIEFKGMVNLPLADDMALRASVVRKGSEGWLTDTTTGQKFGADGNWGSRIALKWTPDADSKLVATWEHETLDQPARFTFSLVNVPPSATATPALPPDPATFINPLDSPLQNDAPNRETRAFDGVSLRYETNVGGMHFTSISAMRYFHSSNAEDNDGTSNVRTYLSTTNAEGNSSLQQEFKLAAKNDLADWIAGASFYADRASQDSTVATTTDTINTIWANSPGLNAQTGGLPLFDYLDYALAMPGSGFGLGNSWQEHMINTNNTSSYSFYTDVIFHLGAATNLTTGLRFTRDTKQASWYVPPYAAAALDAQFLGTAGTTFGQLAGIRNIIFNSAAKFAANGTSAQRSWGDVSPRLVLDHKVNKDTMLFASVSRGFQSGGYDVFNPLASFEPEHMVNYEAGVKGSLAAMHASYEASLFHYKFSNLQNITLVTGTGTIPVYDVTTSDQSATGLDLGGRIELAHDLSAFGSAEFIRQQYDHYTFGDNLTGAPDNLDGQPVGTPLWSLAAGLRYGWAAAGGKAEALLQGTYQSATRCNLLIQQNFGCLNTGAVQTGMSQTKLDLRVGWNGNHFGYALLVNNLLNKQYVVGAGAGESGYTLGTPTASITMPRFIGIEINASL